MKKQFCLLAAITVLLAACGGGTSGPSDKEVRQIAMAEFEQIELFAGIVMSKKELNEYRDVLKTLKVKACEHAPDVPAIYGDDAYVCVLEVSNPKKTSEKSTQEALFTKVDGAWTAPRGIIQ